MLLNNNRSILIYGFDSKEQEQLKDMIKLNGLPEIKIIKSTMRDIKIKDLTENLNLEIYNVSNDDIPNEKVILFNNCTDDEIEKSINHIRNNHLFNPIYAVVTPTSCEWTFGKLIKHLIEEREWYKAHNM